MTDIIELIEELWKSNQIWSKNRAAVDLDLLEQLHDLAQTAIPLDRGTDIFLEDKKDLGDGIVLFFPTKQQLLENTAREILAKIQSGKFPDKESPSVMLCEIEADLKAALGREGK